MEDHPRIRRGGAPEEVMSTLERLAHEAVPPNRSRVLGARLGRLLARPNFPERRKGEVRAEGRAGKAGNRSNRGNRTGCYSYSTNSSRDTPYALAIFVTVGM